MQKRVNPRRITVAVLIAVLLSASVGVVLTVRVLRGPAHPPRDRIATEGVTAPPPGTRPPWHVVATQGPTDPRTVYVEVSWDRSDPAAIGYEVLRDGVRVGTVSVSGDPWNDFAYTDRSVQGSQTYQYQVQALYSSGARSGPSSSARVSVRTDGNIGSGRIFRVDNYSGTDLQRAQAAVAAAKAAGGGIVLFGPRTYAFGGPLLISDTDDVVLRGAGLTRTFLQPRFDGTTTDCGEVGELVVFRGRREALPGVSLVDPIEVGDRTVSLTSTGDLAVGQVIVLDEVQVGTPLSFEAAGVKEDPGTGNDRRNPWDANQIVEIQGNKVKFQDPFSQPFSTNVPWQRIGKPGLGNGIERLTLQGRSADEQRMYKLLFLDYQVGFTAADIQGRWANRNYLETKGYGINVVGFNGPYAGPRSFDAGSCKYKFTINRVSNLVVVNSTFGQSTHDNNQSYLTLQRAQRILIRHSRFYGSRTYAINEHGSGGRDNVVENNYIAVGPRAAYAGVLLGNSSWGFAGSFMIRNNAFKGNRRDLYLQENSYEARFLDNRSDANAYRVVDGYGWAGPNTDPDRCGSLRLTLARNKVSNGKGDGVVLGGAHSPLFPYAGVRDVIVFNNHLGVAGDAIRLEGDRTVTSRFQVWANTGSQNYVRPPVGPEDYWNGNADSLHYGTERSVQWSSANFAWEGS